MWLCSPETAAAAALTGRITDPRTLEDSHDMAYPRPTLPERYAQIDEMLIPPLPEAEARDIELVKGPNISSLPDFTPIADRLALPVLLVMGDDISTDEILPAGSQVLPFRSNIPRIADFAFSRIDESYPERARGTEGGHVVVAGRNYGQGSSREHAVIAPRHLGLQAVIAVSFARIHWQNLANFGIVPLEFEDPADLAQICVGDEVVLEAVHGALRAGGSLSARIGDREVPLRHRLSQRQVDMVLAGGRIPLTAQAV